jgi:hypothetical protein
MRFENWEQPELAREHFYCSGILYTAWATWYPGHNNGYDPVREAGYSVMVKRLLPDDLYAQLGWNHTFRDSSKLVPTLEAAKQLAEEFAERLSKV